MPGLSDLIDNMQKYFASSRQGQMQQPIGQPNTVLPALGMAAGVGSGGLMPALLGIVGALGHKQAIGPNGEPVLEGMIPTKGNLEEFDSRRAALMKQLIGLDAHTPEAMNALSYLGARYPNRMTTADNGIFPSYNLPDSTRGTMQRGILSDTKGNPVPSSTPDLLSIKYNPLAQGMVSKNTGVGELVNTIAHETQHTVDASRWPADKWVVGRAGEYTDRQIEIRARQAGDTALQGYLKYKGLTEAQTKPNWETVSSK